uniref:Exosome complex component RRP45A-like n=1 Tax=Tanacetum cinerariifolium TaxID=118510 RepID=A0A6L2KAD9_TANCI|nr:exosome complex component RRP45A-like [Tanacetum cinerariifolium]
MAYPLFEPGYPGDSSIELGRIVDRGFKKNKLLNINMFNESSSRSSLESEEKNRHNLRRISASEERTKIRMMEDSLQELVSYCQHLLTPSSSDPGEGATSIDNSPSSSGGHIVVIEQSHYEEALMEGSMTATLNTNGDVCAI